MEPQSAEVTIDASRERVFATILDLAVRPAFCDHFITDFRLTRIEPSGVGAAARFRVGPPALRTWMESEIERAEPPHMIFEEGRCGRLNRIPTFTAWELTEGAASLTTVRVVFRTDPSEPIDQVRERLGAAGWYRRQWSKALRRLAEGVEGEEPMPRLEVGGADRIPSTA